MRGRWTSPGIAADGSFDDMPEHASVLPRLVWRTLDAEGNLGWDFLEPERVAPTEDSSGDWEEDGAVWPVMAVDDKRPYGDRSYFELDMADALGIPSGGTEDGEPLPGSVLARLLALHHARRAARARAARAGVICMLRSSAVRTSLEKELCRTP